MPTYDYACDNCGHTMEAFQRMVEDPLTICPECDNPALKRKIGTGAGIIFKGGGFYETDFKDKKGSNTSSSDKPKPASKSTENSDSSKASKEPAAKESSPKASA